MAKDILYPLRRLHGILHEWKDRCKRKHHYWKNFILPARKNSGTIFLTMTPAHQNLGDQAIALAEERLLIENNIPYIQLYDTQIREMKSLNMLGAMNGVPILINGGGNMGTLWYEVETLQREIIRKNPCSPIIFFPNTIYYEDTPWGNKELEKSRKIYNRHANLHIYAREKCSFEFMKKIYRNVKLFPDMVLSLDGRNNSSGRNGGVLSLRSDHERTLTNTQEEIIRSQASMIFADDVIDSDMVLPYWVDPKNRLDMVEEKLAQFSAAQLVITDRLHGMIFAAITGTPCIVVDSKSPKVRGCYEWIRHLDYIRFADNLEKIAEIYYQIPHGNHEYRNKDILPYFEELGEDIRKIID